jgi:hypothetical protein
MKNCHRVWEALACDGEEYNNNHKNNAQRKNAAARFVESHPECGRTANHGPYVNAGTRCNIIVKRGATLRKNRKNRKNTRRNRRNRK